MAIQTELQVEQIVEPPAAFLSPAPPHNSGNANEHIVTVDLMNFAEPAPDDIDANVVTTIPNAREVKGKLFAVFWALFAAGLNDAATGTLIPFLQPAYNVGLLEVALLYLINFIGWLVAAFSNVHVMSRIGQGGLLVVGACLQLFGSALQFWRPPFPVFAISYFFTGIGIAYQDAQAQTFAANLENAYRWLGMVHAVYGLGALVAPLIATTIAAQTPYWNYYYLVMLGVSALDAAFLAYSFRSRLFRPASKTAKETASKDFKNALSQKVVWILSLYFLFYVGAEVTSGGKCHSS